MEFLCSRLGNIDKLLEYIDEKTAVEDLFLCKVFYIGEYIVGTVM